MFGQQTAVSGVSQRSQLGQTAATFVQANGVDRHGVLQTIPYGSYVVSTKGSAAVVATVVM